jgi:hypothetical protein
MSPARSTRWIYRKHYFGLSRCSPIGNPTMRTPPRISRPIERIRRDALLFGALCQPQNTWMHFLTLLPQALLSLSSSVSRRTSSITTNTQHDFRSEFRKGRNSNFYWRGRNVSPPPRPSLVPAMQPCTNNATLHVIGARRRRGGGGPGGGCARKPVGTYLYLHAVGAGNPATVPCLAR